MGTGGLTAFVFATVLGQTALRPLANSVDIPFRRIGRIERGCTGTLISRRHILTAGHCLYDCVLHRWKNLHLTDFDFSPALNDTKAPFGSFVFENAYVPDAFKTCAKESDYGVLLLKEEAGTQLGWFALGSKGKDLVGHRINIVGYPQDSNHTMHLSGCSVGGWKDGRYRYPCETRPGMSGAPIYLKEISNGKAKRTIYGVHTVSAKNYNSGVAFTDADIAYLETLIAP